MNNDSVSLFRMRAIAPAAIITLLVPGFTFAQAGNPMWQSGYNWTCEATARTICERDGTCKIGDAGGVKFEIEYENSRALFPDGTVKIKRHYRQTVNDSPLQAEVKVELADNRVLWLTAVDASRTYSQAWTGAIVEPKGGRAFDHARRFLPSRIGGNAKGMTPDSLTRRQRRELRWWAAELGKDQQGSVPCVSCHGVGLQALENDRDAAVIKNGVGYAAEPCRRCAGMKFFRR